VDRTARDRALARGLDLGARRIVDERRRDRHRSPIDALAHAQGGELTEVAADAVFGQSQLRGEILGDELAVPAESGDEQVTTFGASALPGTTTPDSRGRTGLHLAGRELRRNPGVIIRDVEVTSDGWHVLRRTTFAYRRRDGRWTTEQRETYDRGNGATILLYDRDRRTVLLTRQFRYPVYVNDHPDGMLVEAAAGLLDDDDPETAIRREAGEELGVSLGALTHVFDVYMSPGSVTERVHFYAAPYGPAGRTSAGGGIEEEGEDIEVVELTIEDALEITRDGRIADGKTIMLLQWAALDGPFATPA
jgi:nudix-type nucleoside diphosphatase (YffH/AdpP family)